MDFEEAQSYLLSLGFELSVKKFGLGNTIALLDALGDPQNNYLKVQVAGTNGKGSVCAFLEAILISAGFSVGLNTSPHLVSITERIRLSAADISEAEFARLATIVRAKGEELVANGTLQALPTYFEHVTAMALLAFAESNVDVAILETGLGGRFDATTAAKAEIAVITPVDLDHMKTLGGTLEAIASEKAAIIRTDTDVVISSQLPEALKVILDKCESEGVIPVDASKITVQENSGRFSFSTSKRRYGDVSLSLAGRHQIGNAGTAIAAAETLSRRGIEVESDAVLNGLSSAVHRGRLEYRDGMLFDGAHNSSGARALREYLDANVDQPITMMFAAMAGKDLAEISQILWTKARDLILVKPANPRAMETSEMRTFVPESLPADHVLEAASVADAIEAARRRKRDGIILVTGSLYLVGEVQAELERKSVAVRNRQV